MSAMRIKATKFKSAIFCTYQTFISGIATSDKGQNPPFGDIYPVIISRPDHSICTFIPAFKSVQRAPMVDEERK